MRAGVFLSEIDLSRTIGASAGFYASIQLLATKGEIDKPVLIGRDVKLKQEFTPDGKVEIGFDNAFWDALAYLRKSNKLFVSRVQNKASYSSVITNSLNYNIFTGLNLTANITLDLVNLWFSTTDTKLIDQLQSGMPLQFNTGTNLPSPLVISTTYFAVKVAKGKFRLAATQADALAVTPVLITLVPQPNSEVATFSSTSDQVTLASANLDTLIVNGSVGYFTTNGTLASPIQNNIDYYVKRISNTSFFLCTTSLKATQADLVFSTNFGLNPTYITATAHGLALNAPVQFKAGTLPSPLVADTTYYVKTIVDANNFTVSATAGGVVISLTSDAATSPTIQRDFIDFTTNGVATNTFVSKSDIITQIVKTPLNNIATFSENSLTFSSTADNVTLPVNSPLLNRLGTDIAVRFTNVGGGLPLPLEANTDYYLINPNLSPNVPNTDYVFQLAFTSSDAINGIPINLLSNGTGTTTMVVKMLDVEGYAFQNDECLEFYSKDPGAWGNAYSIKLKDNRDQVPNSFTVEVYKLPDLVNPIERPFVCSRVPTQKDGNGKNIYIENVMKSSAFIRCNDNSIIDSAVMPMFQSTPLRLQGGDIGDQVTTGQLITDLNAKFRNVNRYPNSAFIDGGKSFVGNTAYAKELLALAELRGDCVAILSTPLEAELDNNYLDALTNYKAIDLNANSSWGGLYSPHFKIYDSDNDRQNLIVSPSGYIAGLVSEADTKYKRWFPVAGKTRGVVSNVDGLVREFEDSDLDELYRVGINPIRFIENEGIFVWGQKTLLSYASALDRMNVRFLLNVIEPATIKALDGFVFEFNDVPTRSSLLRLLTGYYLGVQADRGLYGFALVCSDTNNSLIDVDNYEMNTWIFVKPTKAAEFLPTKLVVTRTSLDFGLAQELVA